MTRIKWAGVLTRAADIVRSYDTNVTLRQLHYRLVSEPELGYPNTQNAYKALSSKTADLRRAGTFPDLHDRTRVIHRRPFWTSPATALEAITDQYRRDRTEGQTETVVIGVEKAGLVAQLEDWFGDLGVPIIALGGYSSQSFVKLVANDVRWQGRPAVLLYAGDHDPSGEDIDRDFVERSACWTKVIRVALSSQQVLDFELPPAMGKADDARAAAFVARHGALVQVELDAVPPATLRQLYTDALGEWWDDNAYRHVLDSEQSDRSALLSLAGSLGGDS